MQENVNPRLRAGMASLQKSLPLVLFITGLVILLFVLWQLTHILLLVLASVLVGILLRTLADFIARLPGIGERLGLVIAVALLVLVLAGLSWLLGSQVRDQFGSILDRLPGFIERIEEWTGITDLESIIRERTEDTLQQASLVTSFAGYSTYVLRIAGEAFLVAVGGIYFASTPGLYRKGLLHLLPRRDRPHATETLDAVWHSLQYWLIGQLVSMTIVGFLTGFGLWLLGVPSALALGLIAGFLEFVPYIGPIASAAPALVVAAAEQPSLMLWVAGLYLLVQQLEGNVITPLVQQRAVDLPPALTLFAIVSAGALTGFLGVLLATPIAVILLVLVKKLWMRDTLEEDTNLPGEKQE